MVDGSLVKDVYVGDAVGLAKVRGRCEMDLGYLCRYFLGYKDWDIIHDDMAYFLKTEVKEGLTGRQYILIMVPRGHLKSCVVTKGWAIQQLLKKPNVRILIANAIWDNARGFLGTIMNYLAEGKGDGRMLADYYGPFFPEGKIKRGLSWSPDSITINQRTVPQDAATVTTTGIERTQASQHYEIIILDDVVVRENIGTSEQRDKVKKFYKDCIDLLEPNGTLMVVGTTWHQDDLYSTKPSEDEGSFCGLLYDPDFKVFKRVAEQGTQESVVFKKKFSFEELMKIKKKKGIYEYSSQYRLNPYPEENQTFKRSWIRYWKYPDENKLAEKTLPESLYVCITIDPSLGKERSDYAAVCAVGMDCDAHKYVLEAKRFKRFMEDIPTEIVNTVRRLVSIGYMPSVIGTEYFGFQSSLLIPIRDALKEARLDVHVELFPTVSNKANSKESRILGLVPAFSDSDIFVHDTQKDLIDELLYFNPMLKNAQDNIIDALSWSKVYWSRKPYKVIKKRIEPGSLEWWMTQAANNKEPDLFSEYR